MSYIRKAVPGDAARMAEIEVFNYRLNFYPIFRTDGYFFGELTVPALIADYSENPDKLANSFVWDDSVVKGFVRVRGSEIEKLFVEPAFQGRGIGGMLFDHAVKETCADSLLVLEKNLRAIRLYELHGFHTTEERRRVDDTSEFFIVMRR